MSEDVTQQLPDGDMKQVLALLNSINGRLTALEEKVDRRLQDTRPIWEQVLSRLTDVDARLTGIETRLTDIEARLSNVESRLSNVESRLDNVEARLTNVETRLEAVESEVSDLGRKFRVFNADILKLQNKQEDLNERLRQLESEPAK